MSTGVLPGTGPVVIVGAALALLLLGLSGIERADQMSDGTDLFPRQVIWVLLAGPLTVAASTFPYRRLKPYGYLLWLAVLPLLVVVLGTTPRNGARSWIPLGFFDLQPSELAKLALIVGLAQYLSIPERSQRVRGVVLPFLMTAIPVVLILKEPDLGSAMLFLPVSLAMLFAAGTPLRYFFVLAVAGAIVLPIGWMSLNAEQRSRVSALVMQKDGGPAPQGDGYHQHQSKLVLTLGGLWGSELSGQPIDDPDAYHLPAGQTDFVFCWVGERWGLMGGLLTLLLYVILFVQGLLIAQKTVDPFGRLMAVGIVTLLAAQATINAGMTVGLLPITGITLPLMSYGGSSLLSTCLALGWLVNIGWHEPEPWHHASRWHS